MEHFYISFIPSKWYCNKYPNPYKQLYYIVQKFNKSQLLEKPLTKVANVWYLLKSNYSQHNYKIINDCQFYEKLWDVEDKENNDNKKDAKNEEYKDDNDNVPFDF
ncbi:hypothetical protein C2G38_2203736 [Gigaspora rosea]|uniref:Uncharacterized protein n=1 Tax=Gigaspora rosea TaxID=44941 RepID=A0A397UMD4_9GLOM|nr:hypothetical protein C2G38_2203736 [Gigaspora rosea]